LFVVVCCVCGGGVVLLCCFFGLCFCGVWGGGGGPGGKLTFTLSQTRPHSHTNVHIRRRAANTPNSGRFATVRLESTPPPSPPSPASPPFLLSRGCGLCGLHAGRVVGEEVPENLLVLPPDHHSIGQGRVLRACATALSARRSVGRSDTL